MTQDVVVSDANPEIVIIPEGIFLDGKRVRRRKRAPAPRHGVWVDSFGLDDYQDS